MDALETMRARHSYRAYTDEPVDRETLEVLIEAARLAPSPMNSQPWRFHVATGETRRKIDEVMSNTTVYLEEYMAVMGAADRAAAVAGFASNLGNAPVVIAVSVPRPTDGMSSIDMYVAAGAAIENLLLEATEQGLATVNVTFSFWMRDKLAEILGLSEDREIVSLIAVGHAAHAPVAPPHNADVATWHD